MAGRRPLRVSRNRVAVLAMVAATGLASCDLPRFGAPDAASEQGRQVLDLWTTFFLIAIVVTLFVWVPLIIVLVRYRRTRLGEGLPSQRAYNIPIEVLYTVVPVLLVAVLFFLSVRTERRVNEVAPEPVVQVQVIGFQWGWQFRYDEGFTVDAPPGELPELVLPVGAPTNLELISTDVNHSFWVPDFLSKRDLIPGVDNEITVTPERTGTYEGRCAEFCGLDHWRMSFRVRVVSMDEYRAWAADPDRRVGVDGDGS